MKERKWTNIKIIESIVCVEQKYWSNKALICWKFTNRIEEGCRDMLKLNVQEYQTLCDGVKFWLMFHSGQNHNKKREREREREREMGMKSILRVTEMRATQKKNDEGENKRGGGKNDSESVYWVRETETNDKKNHNYKERNKDIIRKIKAIKRMDERQKQKETNNRWKSEKKFNQKTKLLIEKKKSQIKEEC